MSKNLVDLTEFARSVEMMIDRSTALRLALPTYLLKIVKLSVGMQMHDIDDGELKAFRDSVARGGIVVAIKKTPPPGEPDDGVEL